MLENTRKKGGKQKKKKKKKIGKGWIQINNSILYLIFRKEKYNN